MKKCIILANGEAPDRKLISYLKDSGYSLLICADGGANTAYKYKLIPDLIIGDLDSIRKDVTEYFNDKCVIKKINRQNDTDVEKALKYAISKNYKEAVLLGATGDRLDHSFCNLGIVLKFSNRISVTVIHKKSLLRTFKGNTVLNTIPGETISIYGFDESAKITSVGLKFPLKNIALPFGKRESTSNIATSDMLKLKILNGSVFIVRDLKVMKENGLI